MRIFEIDNTADIEQKLKKYFNTAFYRENESAKITLIK